MSVIGTNGNDSLSSYYGNDYIAGLAGDDILNIGSQSSGNFVVAFGGSGDAKYILSSGSSVLIADSGGNDTLQLPFSSSQFNRLLDSNSTYHAVIDGRHYYFEAGGVTGVVKDFLGVGKIETIRLSDGNTMSFDSLWNTIKNSNLGHEKLPNTGFFTTQKVNSLFATYDELIQAEQSAPPPPAPQVNAPQWFDDEIYMQNKLKQTGLSSIDTLKGAFESAGFHGKDGDYLHFLLYGQYEGISPNALFNTQEYLYAKAAELLKPGAAWNPTSEYVAITANHAKSVDLAFNSAGLSPWEHYLQYGAKEGINPSAKFDNDAYLAAKVAQLASVGETYTVAALKAAFESAGLTPLTHYYAYGQSEGINIVGVQQSSISVLSADDSFA